MTLIAALKCTDGSLVMGADTEEVISEPPLLRTRKEKLRVLLDPFAKWRVIVGGAGEYDYIGMIGDFIQEKTAAGPATDAHIRAAIRESVAEVWRDYARYEQRTINVNLLLGSYSSDGHIRLTVVSGAAVRDGADLEAIGVGDAMFKSLADRFLFHGRLTTVMADAQAARVFAIYALQQAKMSIPGVGGYSRVLTIEREGAIKPVKAHAVDAMQTFFGEFDQTVRLIAQGILKYDEELNIETTEDMEKLIKEFSKKMLREYRKLRKELQRIEDDPYLA